VLGRSYWSGNLQNFENFQDFFSCLIISLSDSCKAMDISFGEANLPLPKKSRELKVLFAI
jgi:hypothetical protein